MQWEIFLFSFLMCLMFCQLFLCLFYVREIQPVLREHLNQIFLPVLKEVHSFAFKSSRYNQNTCASKLEQGEEIREQTNNRNEPQSPQTM